MDTNSHGTPRQATLPILQHLVGVYKVWHEFLVHIPKDARYTLGTKIDHTLIETAELLFMARYTDKAQKLSYLQRAATRLDLAKFFLNILWEIKALDGKKYIALSEKLNEIGKMLGGWLRQIMRLE